MNLIKKYAGLVSVLLLSYSVSGQLVLDNSLPLIDQVKEIEGPGVEFSNIQINCPGSGGNPQMAVFDATGTNLPTANGLLLTSGSAANVIGPNNDSGLGDGLGAPGDGDLDVVSNDFTSDACVVEFDLRMTGDTLKFDFAFGSEEYPEYAPPNGGINDVFGFFISGPGITGPYSNNSKNIALLPDGVTPVAINNINVQTNTGFYIPNGTGMAGEPQFTDPMAIQYDAYTTVLTAISPVDRCLLYHIKLVVADASDDILDTGVFLEKFISNKYSFLSSFSNVYEGCKNGGITFYREDGGNPMDSIIIYLGYTGSAQNGLDYGADAGGGNFSPLPNQVVILPFEDSVRLDIASIDDILVEGGETIIVNMLEENCSSVFDTVETIEIFLYDEIEVAVTDTLICPNDTIEVKGVSPETVFFKWDPDVTGSDEISSFIISPLETEEYILTVQDTFGCVGQDTATIEVIITQELPFRYEYNLINPLEVQFFPDTNYYGGSYSFFWNFNDGTEDSTSTQVEPVHEFPLNGIYEVELQIIPEGDTVDCNPVLVQDVVIDEIEFPNIITPNGDGINDYFRVRGMFGYQIIIYNQWGRKVYENDTYENNFTAEDLIDGMYFCLILPQTVRESYRSWFRVVR